MSVLVETGEMNTDVYDRGGLYRRKHVFATTARGEERRITLADRKLLPCIVARVQQRRTSGPHDIPPLPIDRLAVESSLLL